MNRKLRGSVGHPDVDTTLVSSHVIDAEGDRLAFGRSGEVVLVNLFGLSAPCLPVISELPDQFLLLGVYTDDGQTLSGKALPLGRDILELCVPLRASGPTLLPLIGLQ